MTTGRANGIFTLHGNGTENGKRTGGKRVQGTEIENAVHIALQGMVQGMVQTSCSVPSGTGRNDKIVCN